jgi:hypothetical protein
LGRLEEVFNINMNIEQLSTMTEAELHARANRHLEHLDIEKESHQDKQHHAVQAQVFLDELERRKQERERTESERVGQRDYKMELWVIGLIGAELLIAGVGIFFGWIEGVTQTKVLDQLNKSSAETAATLTLLRQAQEAAFDTQKHTLENIVTMNNTLQDEIDLDSTRAIRWGGGGGDVSGHQVTSFDNDGRSVFWFWGSKIGNNPPTMEKQRRILEPGGYISITGFFESAAKAPKKQGDPSSPITFYLYLTRDNGTKYVAKGVMDGNGYIPNMTTTRKQW